MISLYMNRLSVIPMRCKPSHTSEMISQILYGETLQLIDKQNNWIFVSTLHDNYQGWVQEKQLKSVKSPSSPILLVSKPLVQSLNNRNSYLPMGARVVIHEVANEDVTETMEMSAESLVHLGEKFLGVPYVWGGRTAMGIDCSGYVQLLFMMHGLQLPRDAYQQAEVGKVILYEDRNSGHLAYFCNPEGKINHVGLLVDKNTIIHASAEVRKDTFVREGIYNEESQELTHVLHSIKSLF